MISSLDSDGSANVAVALNMPQILRPTPGVPFDLATWNAAVAAARTAVLSTLDASDFVSTYDYQSVAAITGIASPDGVLETAR